MQVKEMVDLSARSVRLYRQLFLVYLEIWQSAIAKSSVAGIFRESATPKSKPTRRRGVDG